MASGDRADAVCASAIEMRGDFLEKCMFSLLFPSKLLYDLVSLPVCYKSSHMF